MQGKGERTVGLGVCVQRGQLGPRSASSCPQCAVIRSPRQAAFGFRPLAFSLSGPDGPPPPLSVSASEGGALLTPGALWPGGRGLCTHSPAGLKTRGREAVAPVHTLAGLPEDTGSATSCLRAPLPQRVPELCGPAWPEASAALPGPRGSCRRRPGEPVVRRRLF